MWRRNAGSSGGWARILSILLLFALAENAGAASQVSESSWEFPASCGRYLVFGHLEENPDRIVVWRGTGVEKTIRIAGTCAACAKLAGLPVEATLAFDSRKKPLAAHVLELRTLLDTPARFAGPGAARLEKPAPCARD